MSFGQNYSNRFMIDFEDDWSEASFREWAESSHWDISPIEDNLRSHYTNAGYAERPVLMLYTPIESGDQNRLNGYFIPRNEVVHVYGPEGWELIPSTPEEIIV